MDGMTGSLGGRVAVVTGASRGVGRGIALGLGEAGATVILVGRTLEDGDRDAPGSLRATGREVERLGGTAVPLRADLTLDEELDALFDRILAEHTRLDVLVNSAWGGYEGMVQSGEFTWMEPFWRQPRWRWDAMFGAGVRAAYMASARAAESMVEHGRGLVVHVTAAATEQHTSNVAYGASKAATDKLAADMAHELREHGVAVVALCPGVVRTEAVVESGAFDLAATESPILQGRAVAALTADPDLLTKTGRVLDTADLAREYGLAEEA